ncbi:putative sodium/potassium-dependent atpase beta-2 subunit [Operophtera brumata]|uniref:Putative sodium/potassium-dependent atpase beta-2 subunit n=1 Tax=Operophtera brumata TaxID=104452 RepID=A0A0L7LDP6_OPEBR|nr:putative sodium/potassium-dependent atpase beta-2 subunit [Operophtera brumata]
MGAEKHNGVVHYTTGYNRRPPHRPFLQRIQYAGIVIFFSICMCGLLSAMDDRIPYFTLADSIIAYKNKSQLVTQGENQRECGDMKPPRNERRKVWVSCKGERPADNEALGPLNYYPYPGLKETYFPYDNTPGYLSPLVAVQLANPKCKSSGMALGRLSELL